MVLGGTSKMVACMNVNKDISNKFGIKELKAFQMQILKHL